MKILMIAPQPFFSPRGTPISVYARLQALSALGHEVDLLTYHLGEDVKIDHVRILRAGLPGLIRSVRIGPSPAKIPLDLVLFGKANALLRENRYDCIHTHEEAGAMGAALRRRHRIAHVYDMHSSLPEQFVNYRFPGGRAIRLLARPIERWVIAHSDVVIAICPSLAELVRRTRPDARVFVIENTMPGPGEGHRTDVKLPEADSDLIALYTGSFGPNQGIELLLAAVVRVLRRQRRGIRFWLAGGEPEQIERARDIVANVNDSGRVVFLGKRPHGEMAAFLDRADILLSPRTGGTNTPLKIYSYLRAGKSIVATNLPVHTQVLNGDTAVLTGASPAPFADGILSLVRDRERREWIGRNARTFAETHFTEEKYISKVRQAYSSLTPRASSAWPCGGGPGSP